MTRDSELRHFPDRLLRDLNRVPSVPEDEIYRAVRLGYRVNGRKDLRVDLSPKETEVLRYLSRGLSPSDTAGAMFIDIETVKTHIQKAKLLLRAKTTIHAVCEAIRQGLIT